ncbi:PEP-CTERM sorting domain-containing protein [Coraliomargarita parva]|uniref:PEP-CTERM sorting domain-containing protein n=1 Tax=Coraliomargarita parva TaxID=3014050 RepID=UPI0022B3F642|nr:PEP-CTERM sorting domain-containing protein [Coraliomargarita parva]
MKKNIPLVSYLLPAFIFCVSTANAAITFTTEFDDAANTETDGFFVFDTIDGNVTGDAAESATISLVGPGVQGLSNLNNGTVQTTLAGNASESTIVTDSTSPYIIFDLGSVLTIQAFNSYSAHSDLRTAHGYTLYAATGNEAGFALPTDPNDDLTTMGWTELITVSTSLDQNGSQGINITDTAGNIGDYRYFAMDITRIVSNYSTNYGEVDIIAVPEPSTFAMIAGFIGLMSVVVRRRRV